jgi:hypothetical protein
MSWAPRQTPSVARPAEHHHEVRVTHRRQVIDAGIYIGHGVSVGSDLVFPKAQILKGNMA